MAVLDHYEVLFSTTNVSILSRRKKGQEKISGKKIKVQCLLYATAKLQKKKTVLEKTN